MSEATAVTIRDRVNAAGVPADQCDDFVARLTIVAESAMADAAASLITRALQLATDDSSLQGYFSPVLSAAFGREYGTYRPYEGNRDLHYRDLVYFGDSSRHVPYVGSQNYTSVDQSLIEGDGWVGMPAFRYMPKGSPGLPGDGVVPMQVHGSDENAERNVKDDG